MPSTSDRPEGVHVWSPQAPDDVDASAVARLMIAAWGRKPGDAEVATRAEALRAELAGLNLDDGVLLLAGPPSRPTGACRVWRDEADRRQWWLAGLVVDPHRRRCGIGSALAHAAMSYDRRRGAALLRSQAHADNAASIAFHGALGFADEGETVAEDGDRLVNYACELQ